MEPSAFRHFQSWPQLMRMAPVWPGLLHLGATAESVARAASGQVYLASPYTLQVIDPRTGRWSRARSRTLAAAAALHAGLLARRGVTAVSPIVLSAAMCHLPATELDPLDERFWAGWCQHLLAVSRAVVVPDIPGWRQSLGVWREVIWALERNMPVHIYGGAE